MAFEWHGLTAGEEHSSMSEISMNHGTTT